MQFTRRIAPCLWFDSQADEIEWFTRGDAPSPRAFAAMMNMGRLDIAALERACEGK